MRFENFEAGSIHDNLALIYVARAQIAAGELDEARRILKKVASKLAASSDLKSAIHLRDIVRADLVVVDKLLHQEPKQKSLVTKFERILGSALKTLHIAALGKAIALMVYSIVILSLYVAYASIKTVADQSTGGVLAEAEVVLPRGSGGPTDHADSPDSQIVACSDDFAGRPIR